ncbi:MAG: serine/threonine-protein kinase [Polyangiaceae bacterium]
MDESLLREAESALAAHDASRALEGFDAALAREPSSFEPHWGRARALWMLGNVSEAERAARECLRLKNGFEPAFELLDQIEGVEASHIVSVDEARPPRPASSAHWAIGEVVDERYEVRGELGRGGMGVVHRVFDREWVRELAVKSARPDAQGLVDGRVLSLLEREAATWVAIGQHPHIVCCHSVRTIAGVPRIFMELCDGGSFERRIRPFDLDHDGPAPLGAVLDVGIQVAWALAYAHAGGPLFSPLVHQDVKPANILFDASGVARLTDFGLSRAVAGGRGATAMGQTLLYASPEQADASHRRSQGNSLAQTRLTDRTDTWSLAATVLHALIGAPSPPWSMGPFAGEACRTLQRQARLPRELAPILELLSACLHETPAERPTAAQFAHEACRLYERLVGHYPRVAPPPLRLSPEELNNRALALLDLGHKPEGQRLLTRAVVESGGDPLLLYNQVLFGWRAGELTDEAALAALERQTLDEKFYDTLRGIDAIRVGLCALLRLESGDLEAAEVLQARRTTSPQTRSRAEVAALAWLDRTTENLQLPDKVLDVPPGLPNTAGAVFVVGAAQLVSALTTHYVDYENDKLHLRVKRLGQGVVEPQPIHFLHSPSGSSGQLELPPNVRLLHLTASRSGELVAAGADDGHLRIWCLPSGDCLLDQRTSSTSVVEVSLTPAGQWAIARDSAGQVRLWSVRDRRAVRSFTNGAGLAVWGIGPAEHRVGVQWRRSSGGASVTAAAPGPRAPTYFANPAPVGTATAPAPQPEPAYHFGDDSEREGAVVMSLSELLGKQRWHVEQVSAAGTVIQREELFRKHLSRAEQEVKWADEGAQQSLELARSVVGHEYDTRAIALQRELVARRGRGELRGARSLWTYRPQGPKPTPVIALHLLSKLVVSVGQGGALRALSLSDGSEVSKVDTHTVASAGFCESGLRLWLTHEGASEVVILRSGTLRQERTVSRASKLGKVQQLILSPNADWMVVEPPTREEWLITDNQSCRVAGVPAGFVMTARSANKRWLVGCAGGEVLVAEVGTSRPALRRPSSSPPCACLSADGTTLYWIDNSNALRVERVMAPTLATLSEAPVVPAHTSDVTAFALAADSILVIGDAHGGVLVTGGKSRRVHTRLQVGARPITRIAMDTSTSFVAFGDDAGEVHVWELDWKCL